MILSAVNTGTPKVTARKTISPNSTPTGVKVEKPAGKRMPVKRALINSNLPANNVSPAPDAKRVKLD